MNENIARTAEHVLQLMMDHGYNTLDGETIGIMKMTETAVCTARVLHGLPAEEPYVGQGAVSIEVLLALPVHNFPGVVSDFVSRAELMDAIYMSRAAQGLPDDPDSP